MAAGIKNFNIRGVGQHVDPHNSNFQSDDSPPSKKSGVLSYIFLPGIFPQAKELTRGGFGYLALLIAMVYQAVRILPTNHPYTKYENLGKFGIRKVISAAANNVQLNLKNIDQILVFFAIFAGLIILALQFMAFIFLVISGQAWATPPPTGFTGIFSTPNPDTDIAFYMMREVFGIPDMFGALPNGQQPIHIALQGLLQFYNLAMLLIAVIVFLYYVVVVVAETAQTGTPFGQRFSHIYAPIRLVLAIGLLVPINYGLNSAQFITLYAAKIGSGFATTGWTQFNNSLNSSNPLGADNATLIAKPKSPDVRGLVEFMAMVVTCREAYALKKEPNENDKVSAWVMSKSLATPQVIPYADLASSSPGAISSYISNIDKIVNSAPAEDLRIVFSYNKLPGSGAGNVYTQEQYEESLKPHCGSLVLRYTSSEVAAGKSITMRNMHFGRLIGLWNNKELKKLGEDYAKKHSGSNSCNNNCDFAAEIKEKIVSDERTKLLSNLENFYSQAIGNIDFQMQEEIKARGWGGAGIWYNRIAQMNGEYVTATYNLPEPQKYPHIMELTREEKKKADSKFKACQQFSPNLADGATVSLPRGERDNYYAQTFDDSYQDWTCDRPHNSGNFFLDAASAIFGLNGLMSIRDTVEDADGNTVQVHPLAKLSTLGRGLIESAISNMGFAIGFSVFGGMPAILSQQLAGAAAAASSMFVAIATIGLSMGFITYYILPFLPFIYFFFAVGNWVKSIFEAMVGVPLWALAHLRIDGDGIPGKMAMNGYLLIFEIFLRPILTVFGLLGGMAIFTALAAMLNEIFDLVVVNTAGVDLLAADDSLISRHIVDVFFFTVVYAVILYMMAISSFKMINLVPNNILRWLGQSVASFSDNAPDPAQGLTQYAAIGGARIGGQLAGGITELGKGVGGLADGVKQVVTPVPKSGGGA